MKTKHRCLFKMKADECLSEIMAEEGVEEDRERLDYRGKMILAPMVKVGPKWSRLTFNLLEFWKAS